MLWALLPSPPPTQALRVTESSYPQDHRTGKVPWLSAPPTPWPDIPKYIGLGTWLLISTSGLVSAKGPALLEHGDSDKGSLLHLHFFLASAQAQGPLLPPCSLCCY